MRYEPEFEADCAGCGGPLMKVSTARIFERPPGPRLAVWVHARHRDWSARPHGAQPVPSLDAVLASVVPVRPRLTLNGQHPRARRSA
jgi:hypothetical protein